MTTEQQAEKYALQNCVSCNDSTHNPIQSCTCHQLEAAFLAGASSVEVGGCRWVKYKDRKPTEAKMYVIKHYYKEAPEVVAGVLYHELKDGSFWFKDKIYGLQWLDESTSSSEAVVDDAVLFAEFLNKNHMAFDGFGGWAGKINTNHYGSSSKDLYKLFKQRK